MSNDLFLPAVALTMLANAILVAVALRALRHGRADPSSWRATPPTQPTARSGLDRPVRSPVEARTVDDSVSPTESPPVDRASRPAAGAQEATPVEPAPAPRGERAPRGELAPLPTTQGEPASGPEPASAPEPTTVVPPKRRRSPRAAATQDPPEPGRRGRRKFALPPLDDDHEKVNRSIESFLTSGEPTGDPEDGRASAVRDSGAATTVARVAIDGQLGDHRLTSDEEAMSAAGPAFAMVERALRGAARGSDDVAVESPGRYRIVLHSTGELAARVYLRRVRATVEPLLDAADIPLRLVIATATVLDEPVGRAMDLAERRLVTALATARQLADRDAPRPEPRAAGD